MSEPMSDERFAELRAAGWTWGVGTYREWLHEALDEIERLRAENAKLHEQRERGCTCMPSEDGVSGYVCMRCVPPAVEARSDDAALVLPGDAIAANAALAGIEMERRLAPNRYLEGVRAGLAAAAAENAEALEHWIRMRQSSAETEDWTGVLDAHAKVVEMNDCAHWLAGLRGRAEAIAGAAAAPGVDTTPSVARLRAIIAEASKQADPAAIEAAAQRFEREMESEPDWKAEALAWRAWYRGAYPSEGPADTDDVMVIVSRNEQAERAAAAPETP